LNQTGKSTNQRYPLVCPQGDVLWELLGQNFIPCGTRYFGVRVLNRIGLLDQSLAGLDDWDLWNTNAELYSVLAMEEPVLWWRQSTPASQQGTSAAALIVSRSVQQFQETWQKPAASRERFANNETRCVAPLSTNMCAHLSYQAWRALRDRQLLQATRKSLGFGNVWFLRQCCASYE